MQSKQTQRSGHLQITFPCLCRNGTKGRKGGQNCQQSPLIWTYLLCVLFYDRSTLPSWEGLLLTMMVRLLISVINPKSLSLTLIRWMPIMPCVIAPICVVSSQLLTVWLFDTPAFAINCCSIESLVPLWSRVVRFFFLSITSSSFTERLSPHVEDRLVLDALSMLHDVPLWMIQCEESYFPNCPCRTYCKQHVCLFKFASIGASSANRRKSTLFGRFL